MSTVSKRPHGQQDGQLPQPAGSSSAGPTRSEFKTEKEYQAASEKYFDERKKGEKPEAINDMLLQQLMVERYEKLNSLWRHCEDEIKRFLVPKTVVHEYAKFIDQNDAEAVSYGMHTRKAIAWARAKGAWRLCYGIYDETWDQGSEERWFDFTPILDAGIEVRQECIAHLPELRKKVIAAAKETVPQLDQSIAQLQEIFKQF